MAKYKVLRPIEHNLKLYLPATPDSGPERSGRTPDRLPSGGHGLDIPLDTSGVIDLTEAEAAAMTAGQVEPIKKAAARGK
jgi:hypothetical protein